jgi:hypothetical protein
MDQRTGSAAAAPRSRASRLLIALLSAAGLAASGDTCGGIQTGGGGDPPPPTAPPGVHVTVNGIPDDMKGLLVLPPSGWYVNVTVQPGDLPLDPNGTAVWLQPWSGASLSQVKITKRSADGLTVLAAVTTPVDPGTYTVWAIALDADHNEGDAVLNVAVRNRPGPPPIGTGQVLWLDFASDRDATPGPDFPVDLQAFGLGSASAPALSAQVQESVIEAVLDRLAQIYHQADPVGLGAPDPVEVTFSADDPGSGDVTRICVGGEDPTGGSTIGNVTMDAQNANRSSVECATLPPTGIFPRELLVFAGQAAFDGVFDPLRSAAGGAPVGTDPLDAVVLDPSFDPASATPEELDRWDTIQTAIDAFASALGTVIAHESGHALGLVPGGAPGIGLYGGTSGANTNHNVTPSGAAPAQNLVMNAGSTYTFAKLAGLDGQPLALLRPLNHAYLRDRVLVDPRVTALLPPPLPTGVSPYSVSTSSNTLLTVTGSGYAATPSLRLVNAGGTYQLSGEKFVSSTQVTGWVLGSQIAPGVYDLECENPDGQVGFYGHAVNVQP